MIVFTACVIVSHQNNFRNDLNGHFTGGREKAWLFKPSDNIRDIQIIHEDPKIVSLIANGGEGDFFMVLRLDYVNGRLVNIGQLFIQKL